MSKYINQKQLLMSLSDWQFGSQDDERLWETIEKVINSIESLPTIDIVRCKDCEYFKTHESVYGKGWICTRNHIVVGSVDFCSYGERTEE